MSTVNPTDKVLVNRAGIDHSSPADMSTVQDTDLLLINRAGVDYKCTFLDWKNSQSEAPNVGAVTLADVAGGDRFTSTAFPVSATMTDDGTPTSTKKLKAYVEGALKITPISDVITNVAGNVLTFATGKDLSYFAAGDVITELNSTGAAGDATGSTVGAVDVAAKTLTLATTVGAWDVGSSVKGPPKSRLITPKTSAITNVGISDYSTSVSVGATSNGTPANLDPAYPLSNVFTKGNFTGTGTSIGGSTAVRVLTFTFPQPIEFTSSIEVLCYNSENIPNQGKAALGWIDDKGVASSLPDLAYANGVAQPPLPMGQGMRYPIPNLTPGTKVKSIVYRMRPDTGAAPADFVVAIYVDGVRLIDSSSIVLTVTDDKDLVNFSVGDVVQGGNYSRGGSGGTYDNTTYGWGQFFDGNLTSTWVQPAQNTLITFTANPPISATTAVLTYLAQDAAFSSGGYLKVNGTNLGALPHNPGNGTAPLTVDIAPYLIGGKLNKIECYMTSTANSGLGMFGLTIDGKILDNSSAVSVISIDKAKPSITTDGGSWSGTDGTSSGTLADREAFVTGPLKTQMTQYNQALVSHVAGTSLTFAPGTDMSLLAPGDAVVQKLPSGQQSVVFYSDKGDISTDPNLGYMPGDVYSDYTKIFAAGSSPAFVLTRPNARLIFKFDPPLSVPTVTSLATSVGDANTGNSYNLKINGVNFGPYITVAGLATPTTIPFVGSINTLEVVGGLAGVSASKIEIDGVKVVGLPAPQGVVGSVTGTVVSLSASSGTWIDGRLVDGPPKPINNVKLYCKLNAAGAVSDLQSADPGFTAWTPAGTGPYTGTVTFPATLPTGNAPDVDLPAGTTVTVEVEATNTSGTDSAKSNTVTPT